MDTSFTFVGHSLDKEKGEATFTYKLSTPQKSYDFTETLVFPIDKVDWNQVSSETMTKSLDSLLLILGISYWKLLCPTNIKTPTISLTHEQAIFWETVYTKGLGEFFYKNDIDFTNLIHFPFTEIVIPAQAGIQKEETWIPHQVRDDERSLLFFGGGKDSIVAAELLKRANKNFSTIVINPTDIHKKTLEVLGIDSIFISRKIDSQLFALNKQNGFFNGHVPATAINDFIGIFAAILYNYTYIISSNEKSASFGNVEYLGQEINHQWSKSFEFERMLSEYVQKFITNDLKYFSLLRPLNEIKIAEVFSTFPKYFSTFSSCNRNFKLNRHSGLDPESPQEIPHQVRDDRGIWCCECPKCLFVFILLAAFLPKEKMGSIFGKNLLNDTFLLPLVKKLLGIEKIKPFECVGTPEETTLALLLVEQKGEYTNDSLMDYFRKEVFPIITEPEKLQSELLSVTSDNIIPKEFRDVINNL